MYISSDGTEKDPSTLNTEYLINALAKSLRDIFTTKNMEEYSKYMNNIEYLELELSKRIDKFVDEHVKEWE